MLDFDRTMQLIGQWAGTLKFFPSDSDARIGIAKKLAGIVGTEDQLEWLVQEAPDVWVDWPGILAIRALYCSRYDPIDGRQAESPAVDYRTMALKAPEPLQITGLVGQPDPDFPRDVFSLMAEVAVKKFPALDPGTRAASREEIESLKALQNSRRKESAAI